MTPINDALNLALAHHQAGRLADAEPIYRQILAADPRHADALYLLGRLVQQDGRLKEAIRLLGEATQVVPGEAAYRHGLAEALRAAGDLAAAVEAYRHALSLQPDYAIAWRNLGRALVQLGEPAEAESALRSALRLQPAYAECYNDLGGLQRDRQQFDEALQCYERALALRPDFAEAHNNLANLHRARGNVESAIDHYRRAIALQPLGALWHVNLADMLHASGQTDEAVLVFRQALQLDPDSEAAVVRLAELLRARGDRQTARDVCETFLKRSRQGVHALVCLGTICHEEGKFSEAEACFQRALSQDGALLQAELNLGYTLRAQGKLERAIQHFEAALRLEPTAVEAHNGLAAVWMLRNRPDRALEHCRAAIAGRADFALAYGNLAAALQLLGRQAEALAAYRQAIPLDPSNAALHGNLLYAMHCSPDMDAATLAAEHRAWARRHADPLLPAARRCHECGPRRRLRVGYVSPYFCAHAVNSFVEPILASHDHAGFEVSCYSDVVAPDETTDRLQKYADRWRSIVGWSDAQVAQQIEADRIDVLLDLSGHIGGNRLLAFARRPAPVQVTYIGYQNTTGMQAMDYRLTDDVADPPGMTEGWHTERLWRMPGSFFTYLPPIDAPPVRSRLASAGDALTFGSFNNFMKITPQVLAAWRRVLERVPRSRLVVLTFSSAATSDQVRAALGAPGLDVDRVQLVDRLPYREYLELIGSASIALDTFPFNGHTTVCDSLWMGTPVITLAGDHYASRYGGCALEALGLGDLIAHDVESYIESAVALAADRPRLARLQATLRERMRASVLLDAVGFTRELEAAYRQMWHRWCASEGTP